MSFETATAACRRRDILRLLDQAPGYAANEQMLRNLLHGVFGYTTARDVVRGDLAWLQQQALLRVEALRPGDGELWLAHVLEAGRDVVAGRSWPGIARPEAG